MDILEKLKQTEIIKDKNVLELKSYISKKYPHLSSHEAALMFSDSIYKIIDNNIRHFDKEVRDAIKKSLISNSVHRSSFFINGDDILNTYINLNMDGDTCTDSLIRWVNENQDEEISKEYLSNYITEVKKCGNKYISEDIQLDNHLRIVICVFFITICSLTIFIKNDKLFKSSRAENDVSVEVINVEEIETRAINELPLEFKYKNIDINRLREWLNSRDSKLANEPYLTTIVDAAEEFNINPLLLIAITGQEQNFVPRSNENSEKMANNPFNVYGSWMEYNTDIYDSSRIAARTVVNLGKDRQSDIDVIQWINRKYAEDKDWHKGVTEIFNMLSEELEN